MGGSIVVPRRARLLLAVAAAHLAVACVGAFEVRYSDDSWPARALSRYAALTGADSRYGFFAPFVGTQLRMTFEVTYREGNVTEEPLNVGAGSEIELRISNVVALFWIEDEALRRALSASLAGKMFVKHPEAASIAVRLDVHKAPSMERFRAGDRPSWAIHYRARFVPRAGLGAHREEAKGGDP